MSDAGVFVREWRVGADDTDRQGHVNNVAFVKQLQDVAVAHWAATAPEELRAAYTWVVRRHEVDYLRPGLPGDVLTVRTWVGEPSGATWERHTEVTRLADGHVVVRARTVWVLLDATTGRPRRIDSRLLACFGRDDGQTGTT
jgi:acyl-CoA thioester hydrolase